MKKIVIYHTDLDGYGVKVACKIHYMLRNIKEEDVVYVKADYYGYKLLCDDKIYEILKGHEDEFDEIILGDISVTKEETAEYLNELSKTKKIILRDHHESAIWMNKYEYAKVREKDEDGIYRSGTYWIQKELLKDNYVDEHPTLKKFLYLCDMFDTWKWAKTTPKLTDAEDLSLIFDVLNEEGFDKEIYPKLLSEKDEDLSNEKISFYLDYMHKDLNKNAWASFFAMRKGIYIYKDESGKEIPLKVGIISTSSGSSMISERLRDICKKKNVEIDFFVNVTLKGGLALRADDNCKVPCNLIIKQMTGGKGGGHMGSAGGSLPVNRIEKGLTQVFDNLYFDDDYKYNDVFKEEI